MKLKVVTIGSFTLEFMQAVSISKGQPKQCTKQLVTHVLDGYDRSHKAESTYTTAQS